MTTTVLCALIAVGTAAAQTPQTRPATPAAQAPRPTPPAAQTPAPAPAAPVTPAVPVAFPADARIGFVNMQSIVSQSKLGKMGQDRMKELKSGELAGQNKQMQTLQQEIQAGQTVLSATVLAQKNAELDRLTREIQFKQEQAQADVQALNDQLLDEFSTKVLPIVEQIRAEKNLWVVFALGDGTGVAAVHAGLDLSAEVIKRLDAAK
jgi:Skp family chaperone for outer membrane proteins